MFVKSVSDLGEVNNNLYINSLSGYFIDSSVAYEGLYPFKASFDGFTNYNGKSDVTNQGKGGDHPRLAYELNKYVYGILSGKEPMSIGGKLEPGPWGFVIMEHIGNTTKGSDDKSLDLVDLIMMNNFKIELGTSGSDAGGNGGGNATASVKDWDSVYLDGQNAISFE